MASTTPVIEVLILCSKSKKKFNPLGRLIEKEEGLGFSHFSIGILFEGQFLISEAVYPRPRFISLKEWLKLNEPMFVFRKEIKNQSLMFKMMAWQAITCTASFYSIAQLVLIYIGKLFPSLKNWSETVKLNHERGLICCEYITFYLRTFFDFSIDKSDDSIGLREPFDELTRSWVLLDPVQTAATIEAYSRE